MQEHQDFLSLRRYFNLSGYGRLSHRAPAHDKPATDLFRGLSSGASHPYALTARPQHEETPDRDGLKLHERPPHSRGRRFLRGVSASTGHDSFASISARGAGILQSTPGPSSGGDDGRTPPTTLDNDPLPGTQAPPPCRRSERVRDSGGDGYRGGPCRPPRSKVVLLYPDHLRARFRLRVPLERLPVQHEKLLPPGELAQ